MADTRIIFICYRREDSLDHAHRLHDSLRTRFGDDQVFIDLNVPPGADVRRYIAEKLSSCGVLLAVIGPDWLTSIDERGKRRLASELDFVRLELATALNNDDTLVVPVLIRNAEMPVKSELPQEIARLADRHAHELSDGVHWHDDVTRLISALETILPTPPVPKPGKQPPPRLSTTLLAIWKTLKRHPFYTIAALAALAALIVLPPSLDGERALKIYSSLPQREQLQPEQLQLLKAGGANLPVVPNERTRDMEDAMRLALTQAEGKAGDFDVTYSALDDSDATGESPTALVQSNARRAAEDENTALYIGDLASGATQASIPILSKARIPQISMSSTRVGLTTRDPRGDVDEPGRYYPKQRGYSEGYRNFVRIIPRDGVQAKALLALMAQQDNCARSAMINDNSSYGQALANNILARNHGRVEFVFSESVTPRGHYEHLVSKALERKPDCVVYCGTRNTNTVEIFEAFAAKLPRAKLYGTDGLVAASFVDFRKGGISRKAAGAVKVMVPPYDVEQAEILFFSRFRDTYKREPDLYAVYAYEAMQVALKAIADSASGERKDIVTRLFAMKRDRQGSVLGKYSIGPTGDTTVTSYGVSMIEDGELTTPTRAPMLR